MKKTFQRCLVFLLVLMLLTSFTLPVFALEFNGTTSGSGIAG